MPSPSNFLQNLKITLYYEHITENRPADVISFMSVTKKKLSSNLELMWFIVILFVFRPLDTQSKFY